MLNLFAHYLNAATKTTGKKAKVEVTRRYLAEYPSLAELFELALSPYCTFGVAKLPLDLEDLRPDAPVGISWETVRDTLNRLANRELTGHNARDQIHHLMSLMDHQHERDAFSAILLKDLRCGVGIETVNAARPGTVPQFGVQLAVSEMPKLAELSFPILVEPKYDGVRTIAIKENGQVKLFSREGRPFENFVELANALTAVPDGTMLDGEVISPRGFQTLMTRVKAGVGKATDVPIKYKVFDGMPLTQFRAGDCSMTLTERREWVDDLSSSIWHSRNNLIEMSPAAHCYSADEVEWHYAGWCQLGLEGVMLKDPNGGYTFKRNKTWRKLKPFASADLMIVGMVEGVGKFAGSLGALLVEGNLEDGRRVRSEVGSFRCLDSDRLGLWQRKDELVNTTIAEIRYQEVTEDNSLRFASFLRLREDR